MSMLEPLGECKFCEENGHAVLLVPYENGGDSGHVYCPCCDRNDRAQYHDTKEEKDFDWPDDGIGPSPDS